MGIKCQDSLFVMFRIFRLCVKLAKFLLLCILICTSLCTWSQVLPRQYSQVYSHVRGQNEKLSVTAYL